MNGGEEGDTKQFIATCKALGGALAVNSHDQIFFYEM